MTRQDSPTSVRRLHRHTTALIAVLLCAFACASSGPARAETADWSWTDTDAYGGDLLATGAGDVNGDGALDLAVYDTDHLADDAPALLIFHGDCNGNFPATPSEVVPRLLVDVQEWGAKQLGSGDFNGDGYSDVFLIDDRYRPLVCDDPDLYYSGHCPTGRVVVWFGSSSGVGNQAGWSDPAPEPQNGQLGFNGMAVAGDLDGDRVDDLLVGDPLWCEKLNPTSPLDEDQTPCWGKKTGRVAVFMGGSGFPQLSEELFGPVLGDTYRYHFTSYFGASMAILGDIDGRSGIDVAIGAENAFVREDAEGRPTTSEGAVYIHDGSNPTSVRYVLRNRLRMDLGATVGGPGQFSAPDLGELAVTSGELDEQGDFTGVWRINTWRGGPGGPMPTRWELIDADWSGWARRLPLADPYACSGHTALYANHDRSVGGDTYRHGVLADETLDPEGSKITPCDESGEPLPGRPKSVVGVGDTRLDSTSDRLMVIGREVRLNYLWEGSFDPKPCPERNCVDGIDNDGDGAIDCDDSDCCWRCPSREVDCDNGLDDDGDGFTDCDDPDCAGEDGCADDEVNCTDGIDNDGDGFIDCDDSDCAGGPSCVEICDDGIDNDQDSLVDCDDPDCDEHEFCNEICDDGIDNDEDGLVDCVDDDCFEHPACDEICDDDLDNDADGLTDCADPDCSSQLICAEICDDGIDNNFDGRIDCRDPVCADTAHCMDDEEEQAPPQNSLEDCLNDFIPDCCDGNVQGQDVRLDTNRIGAQMIVPHAGQEQFDATDLVLRGRDPVTDIRIRRRHVTGYDFPHSGLGESWTLSYRQSIEETPRGNFVYYGYGRKDVFLRESVGAEAWIDEYGRYERLRFEGDVAILRTRGGNELRFDTEQTATGRVGLLTSVRSSRGNEVAIVHESSGAEPEIRKRKITGIVDSFGRTLAFRHDDASNPKRLTGIVDPDGREVSYGYDASDRLATARLPTAGSGARRTVAYAYRGSTGLSPDAALANALTGVVYPREFANGGGSSGPTRFAWAYEESEASPSYGRVIRHTIGNTTLSADESAGGDLTYAYEALGDGRTRTTIDSRAFARTILDSTKEGWVEREEIRNYQRSELPASFVRTFAYNDDGDLLDETLPLGNGSVRSLQTGTGLPRFSQGNETAATLQPDAARGGGGQASITPKVVYEPIFNKPFKTIDPRGVALGDEAAYTTIHEYDYMEDLPAAVAHHAPRMGLTTLALQQLLDDAGVVDIGDANGDGVTNQLCGNLIRIRHPQVSVPTAQDATEILIYNSAGQLSKRRDAEGNTTVYEYYPDTALDAGLTTASGVGGFLRRVIRDAEDHVDRTTTAPLAQQVVSFEYSAQAGGAFPANSRGIPTAVIDPRGVKHVFHVNEQDQVQEIRRAADVSAAIDPSLVAYSYVETREFDENGNVTKRTVDRRDTADGDLAPVVTTYEYDVLDQVRRIEDGFDPATGAGGIVTELFYTEDGVLEGISRAPGTSAEQNSVIFSDNRGLPDELHLGIEGGVAAASLEIDVDENGNVTGLIDAAGADEHVYEYDGYDRVKTIVDRTGARVEISYDAASNPILVKQLGSIDGVDPTLELLAEVELHYDERGRLYRQDRRLFHLPSRAVGILDDGAFEPGDGDVTTLIQRDRLGRPVSVTDGDGDVTTTSWDGLSRVFKRVDPEGNEVAYSYDAAGNLESVTRTDRATGLGDETFTTSYAHDSLNRRVSITEPNGQVTRFEHDSFDNLVRRTDQLQNEVEYRHDRWGRLIDTRIYLSADGTGANASNVDTSQGGGDGIITFLQEWDEAGRLISRTDDRGNQTFYTYDKLDRLTRIDFEDGTYEERTYNADGELQTRLRADGSVETWQNDAEGRPTRVDIDLVGTTTVGMTLKTWTRDGLGRVVESFADNGAREDVTVGSWYDSLGRVIRERQTITGFATTLDVDFEWQGPARMVRMTYPDGRQVARQYDGLDRVVRIHDGPDSSAPLVTEYEYVGATRLLQQTLGNGLVLDMRNDAGTSSITGTNPGYDTNGRTVRRAWKNALGEVVAGYLTTWNGPGGVGTNRRVSEERIHGFLGAFPGPTHRDDYTLDSSYRHVAFVRNQSESSVRSLDGANKMATYFENGIAHTLVVDGDPLEAGLNQYSSVDGVPRTYDDGGSLVDDGQYDYFWDNEGRLVEARASFSQATHVFDADGRRILTNDPVDGVQRFAYAGWQVVEERGQFDALTRQHVTGLGIDDHVQMRSGLNWDAHYFHSNAQGSVGVLTDDTGAPAEAYEYGWFGQPHIFSPSNPTGSLASSAVGNPYMFQGRRWEPFTGLYHFRNRQYDPELGEFLSIDPLGVWGHGVGNGYDAFGGNAWDAADPLGLMPDGPIPMPNGSHGPQGVLGWGNPPWMHETDDWPGAAEVGWSFLDGTRNLLAALWNLDRFAFELGPVDWLLDEALGLDLGESLYLPFDKFSDRYDPTNGNNQIAKFLGELGIIPEGLAAKVGMRALRACVIRHSDEVAEALAARGAPKVHMGKQGKHIPGHNNFIEGRSVLTADPEVLARQAGTGHPVNKVARGQAGFKERVDFGEVIGDFVEDGVGTPTTNGIITYASDGSIHIIPARP